VLSEIPDQWRERVMRWREVNTSHRTAADGTESAPAPDEEYLLYQTLIGAWPLDPAEAGSPAFAQRIQAYMIKAMREAKLRTSWVAPNEGHEAAVKQFVARILDRQAGRGFLDDFVPFQRRISHFGMLNSLSQTLLRLTSPGVPDTYQGTEVWDFSLVDPDNRRPVNYEARRRLLDGLRSEAERDGLARLARRMIHQKETGEVKMYVTWRALQARRASPGLFSAGEYVPGQATGPRAAHVFAFARRQEGQIAVMIVPRLVTKLAADDRLAVDLENSGDTLVRIPGLNGPVRLRNAFTGEIASLRAGEVAIPLSQALASFPIALLLSE
jgi:(1->4)-alpha-D-glucan 1-alpha-D-glucosylmutase